MESYAEPANGARVCRKHCIMPWYTKARRAQNDQDYETWIEGGVMPTMNAFDNGDVRTTIVIFSHTQGLDAQPSEALSPTLRAGGAGMAAQTGSIVRRLVPVECERLQGFPDDWTAGQSDSTRYKQMGNAVAVPVVEWVIGNICDIV